MGGQHVSTCVHVSSLSKVGFGKYLFAMGFHISFSSSFIFLVAELLQKIFVAIVKDSLNKVVFDIRRYCNMSGKEGVHSLNGS